MLRRLLRSGQAIAAAGLLLAAGACENAGHGGTLISVDISPDADDPKTFIEVTEFDLVRHDGEAVGLQDLLGTPFVLACFFTKCNGPCPSLLKSLVELQNELEDTDVRLVSVTVDPTFDDPEQLTKTARVYGMDLERWWLLTGEETEIYALLNSGFGLPAGRDEVERESGDHWYTHDTRLVAVDREGKVRGWYHHQEQRDELEARMRHLASE